MVSNRTDHSGPGKDMKVRMGYRTDFENFPYWELANPTEGSRQHLLLNLRKKRSCERSEISESLQRPLNDLGIFPKYKNSKGPEIILLVSP